MANDSRLAKMGAALQRLPRPLRERATSLLVGQIVPYVGTSGARIEELGEGRVVVAIPNRRKVRNHIGTIHAAAVTLAAETASGFVVGISLPARSLPLIRTMKIDFEKRTAPGTLRAIATLTAEQRRELEEKERGSFAVEVRIDDGSGGEPVVVEMVWAWVPNRAKAKS